MLDKSAQSGRAPLKERRNDCYDTPPEAVNALLGIEKLPPVIWEPACGTGNIVDVLRNAGHSVLATDLNRRGCPDSESSIDFLLERSAPRCVQTIVTNPPYALAEQFITHALELCPLVIMLLRLAFLESGRRTPILDGGKLARVHVFRNRLPRMHRAGYEGRRTSSSIAFAWFVWDRDHKGATQLDRISWSA